MADVMYIDQDGLESRYGKERVAQVFSSLDPTGSNPGSVDIDAIETSAIDASAEVTELLGVEYVVPFTAPYDPAIVEITAAFTMYRGCATRRPEFNVGDAKPTNPYEADYKRALDRCKEIKLDKRRLTNAALRPANVGGLTLNYNPTPAQPFYFTADPTDPNAKGGY